MVVCVSCEQVLSESSMREDKELRDFLQELVGQFLYRNSHYTRLDFLLCPVATSTTGQRLLVQVKELVGVPVHAASDVLGACISETHEYVYITLIHSD